MTTPPPHAHPTSAPDDAWWRSAVVYQVYPRSFQDSDGDGIGDLRGIIDRLDHLEQLGVDVVWVSPFYRSPMDDNGYDVADHRDVDPLFGTLADVDELIAELHERGMRLVIDVVLNHTSDEHPWFVASRSSPHDPKRDWYWWRAPRPGHAAGEPGAEPTNWTSYFSGPTWELDEASGEYYLHLFSRKQPDLNWENPEVRHAVYDLLRWWVDRGVDGFRMDVINLVSKRLPLRDGPADGPGRLGDGTGEFVCGPRIHEFLQELHAAVIAPAGRELVTIGEMPGVTLEHARRFTDPAEAEVDMVFQFEHVGLDHGPGGKWDVRPLDLPDLKASLARWQTGLGDRGWNSLYWNNHDQPRAVSRFGSDDPRWRERSAKLLGTVLHLHRGTPFVYQGEELGLPNHPFASIDEFRDIETLNHHRERVDAGDDEAGLLRAFRAMSRDNARTPIPWEDAPHAGFTTGEPWIALHPDAASLHAAGQREDPGSVFHHYRRLIALRKDEPTVVHGDFTLLAPGHPTLYAFTRRWRGTELLVLANLSDAPLPVALDDLDGWTGAELVLGNLRDDGATDVTADLRPWEARVLRRSP